MYLKKLIKLTMSLIKANVFQGTLHSFWFFFLFFFSYLLNSFYRIGGVMVRMLESSVVDRGFESRSGETKEYTNWYLLLLC